ncbi:MAG: T9SS type A sorting domain-containing protein [Lewinellaceae bacterium]|nr:T9SS type A sorting domain-containing protein [Lewinellaceae bacterium]
MIHTIRLALFLSLASAWVSCHHRDMEHSDKLQQKAEPYDQFSFQRSYPDRDFDWKGWRKRMASLRLNFTKSLSENSWAENGANPNWTLQGPGNVAGRINTLAIHPEDENIVLAGFSAGGIFKTTDGGLTWKPVFDNHLELSIGHISYDPNNPNIVYAGTGDPNMPAIVFNGNGVYKSTDGGESWTYLGLSQEGIISKVFADPSNSNTLFASVMGNPYVRDSKRGVYKSTDGGQTWQNVLFVSEQAGASDLVINPANPQILYASFWDRIRNNQESIIYGTHSKIFKSSDGGATWNQLGGGLPSGVLGRTGLAISPQNPDKIYAVFMDSLSTPEGLYKTTDGGLNWISLNVLALKDACGDFGWYFGKIRVNPVNDEEVYFLGIILWRKDAGSTQWQPSANSHADCHDLQFASTGKRYLATDGGIYRNTPGQMQWFKSNNLPTTQFYHTSYNPHEPDTYYAGAQDNGIQKGNGSIYNGWSSLFSADGFRCAFHPADPNIFWVETQNGNIHKTTDGGQTWQFGQNCLGTPDRCNWDTPYFISQHSTSRLFAGTYRVYFSDNGSGWGAISGDLTDGIVFGARFHNISCLAESPVLAEKLLAGTSDGNVWRREPTSNWVNISAGLPDRYVTSVTASPTLANRIFVTNSGFRDNEYIPHIHRSDDNGQSWTDIGTGLPNVPVNDLFVMPGHADSVLFAGTDAGVYFSLNSGQQWQRLGTNLPFVPVFDLERNPVRNELLAATYARGLWTFPLDSIFSLQAPPSVVVSGTIKTEGGEGIEQVLICDQPFQETGTTGAFEILSDADCLASGLYPMRNNDPLNGVSTFDLVLINRHILGIEALNSPYKIIAADANNSRSVSTFDIVTLRKLILGIDTVLTNVDSWRFIPDNYNFPDPLNPFGSVFPEGINLNPADPPQLINFTGLKVGDVNGNAAPNLVSPPQDRTTDVYAVFVNDLDFETNENLAVPFLLDLKQMAGIQFTVQYDPDKLIFEAVEPVLKGITIENFGLKPGGRACFTTCFEQSEESANQSSNVYSGALQIVFQAKFRSKASGTLQSSIRISNTPTPAKAFRQNSTLMEPVLQWKTSGETNLATWQVFPNPVGPEGVWFEWNGAPIGDGTLRIFNASGKLILTKKLSENKVKIQTAQLAGNGMYWYEIRQGTARWTGKLAVIDG